MMFFDVAVGPMYLVMFGIPALFILLVAGFVVLAVFLIRRALKKKKDDET